MRTMNTKKQVVLSEEVVVKAEARARVLGLTLAEYVQFLVDKDVGTKAYDPWLEPVPQEVAERWSRELAEADKEERTNPRPGAKTVAEFRKRLEEEIAQLPDDDDEGN
jgi:hypothetical protein